MNPASGFADPSTPHVPQGVLLVGHGTREEAGQAAFLDLADRVAQRLDPLPVAPGFLELAQPDIPGAIESLIRQGARRIVVAPVLLFSAGHAQHDIPDAVARTLAAYDEPCQCVQVEHLGCHPSLIELSVLRYRETLAGIEDYDPQDTVLLLVGRGSRDASANAESWQFARLRWESEPVGWLAIGYAAMTEPSLARALSIVGGLPFRRVVVQPHLLFHGELSARIAEQSRACGAEQTAQAWHITPPLGVHELLVEAVCQRIASATVAGPLAAKTS